MDINNYLLYRLSTLCKRLGREFCVSLRLEGGVRSNILVFRSLPFSYIRDSNARARSVSVDSLKWTQREDGL